MISRLRDAGIYRWIRAHQFAHFCCVICSSALFPIWSKSNTLTRHCCWLRPASARMFQEFREYREFQLECEEAPNVVWSHSSSSYGLTQRGWQMGNMAATWPHGIYLPTPVERRCWDVAARHRRWWRLLSSLIGTRGAKITINSLMKAWKVAPVTVLCLIMWWIKPMSSDMPSVMLTFLPRGTTTLRTCSPNGAWPLLLRVKMLNPDSSMYIWCWWTPVKEGIDDDVAQTGKCEYWPKLTNHVAYWKRCSIVLRRFISYGTSLSFPAILLVWNYHVLETNHQFLTNRGDAGERLLYSFSCSSLMKAYMSSVSLMLRAPPSDSLCTRPSANHTRMMLRSVWYGMPRRAAGSW